MTAWLGIVAILIGTMLTRTLVPLLGARVQLTPGMEAALRFAPGCALAAIVLPELLQQHGNLVFGLDNLRLPAAAFAAVVSYLTRSTLGTIVSGMLAFWALTALLSP